MVDERGGANSVAPLSIECRLFHPFLLLLAHHPSFSRFPLFSSPHTPFSFLLIFLLLVLLFLSSSSFVFFFFPDIVPWEATRVVLQGTGGLVGRDYINANRIDPAGHFPALASRKGFIAAQGPLLETQDDFWKMVWQEKVPLIVMLTKLKEADKVKCVQYWPGDTDPERKISKAKDGDVMKQTYGEVIVTLIKGSDEPDPTAPDIIERVFKLEHVRFSESRTVTQYQYIGWPDMNVPRDPKPFGRLLTRIIAKENELMAGDEDIGRTLVHCSAGVGRTGTLIATYMERLRMEDELKKDTHPISWNIFRLVDWLRSQRTVMVQTQGQYEFVYQAVLDQALELGINFDKRFGSNNGPKGPKKRMKALSPAVPAAPSSSAPPPPVAAPSGNRRSSTKSSDSKKREKK